MELDREAKDKVIAAANAELVIPLLLEDLTDYVDCVQRNELVIQQTYDSLKMLFCVEDNNKISNAQLHADFFVEKLWEHMQ